MKKVRVILAVCLLLAALPEAAVPSGQSPEMERLFQEGNKAYSSSDYATALAKFQKALALAQESGNRQWEGAILNSIGMVYDSLGQYDQALEHYQQALAIEREIKDRRGEGITLNNIGAVYIRLGQYDRALEHFQQALAIAREIKYRQGEGHNLTSLGNVYFSLGQYDRAREHYHQALAIAREIKYRQGEGDALAGMGNVYCSLGQYDRACEHYQQALTLARELKDRQGEWKALEGLGLVYLYLGQYDRAQEYHQRALAIARELKDRRGQGDALHNLGTVYLYLGQYERAREHYQQALTLARELKDRQGEGRALDGLGLVYLYLGQYDRAREYHQQAMAIARELKDREGEGGALINLGVVYRKLGQYDRALTAFREGLKICQEVGAAAALWEAQGGLGAVEFKQAKYGEAIQHYRQALDTIEGLRAGLGAKEAKTTFMQDKLYIYDELIELLRSLHEKDPGKGYDRDSLEIFERKQGRLFLEEMGKSGARNFAGLPEEVRGRESDLENQLESRQALLVKGRSQKDPDRQRLKELEARLQQTKDQLQGLKAQIEKDYPDYYALKYPKPATLKEVQEKVLKPGEVLLVYGVMEKTTCLWLVSPKEFSLHSLNIGEKDLHQKITSYRQGMLPGEKVRGKVVRQARPEAADQKVGRELYQLLLPEKVRQALTPGQLLYIVPTGPLYALPFEALETQEAGQPPHYLLQDHPVAYLSSASLLKVLREAQARKKDQPAHPFLAFAHPVYPQKPEGKAEADTIRGMRDRAYRDQAGGEFTELPETADEVKAIGKLLQAPEASQPLNLRGQAARSRVLALQQQQKLAAYRYVVFACHGLLPEKVDPLVQPALVLSHPEKDGYLTMSDVFGLKLNADLVSLSACNTGRGSEVKGEGVVGLTRAFMYAGTPAVGVTLWSVESLSAKDLNIGMHRYLSQGLGRAEALRRIKLDMLQGEKEFGEKDYRHPHFWAPLVVFGDGQ